MAKRILTFFYFAIILTITVFIVFGFAGKSSDNFLKDNKDLLANSNYDSIVGSSLSYTGGKDSFIKKDAIFEEHYLNNVNNLSIDFKIYSIVQHKSNKTNNGLAFIINNPTGSVPNLVLDHDGRPFVFLSVYTNEMFKIGNEEYEAITQVFEYLYDGETLISIINIDIFKRDNKRLNISKIEVGYGTYDQTIDTLFVLNNDEYSNVSYAGYFGEEFNRDIGMLSDDFINVLGQVSLDEIKNDNSFYFNKELVEIYAKRNKNFVLTISLWSILVLIITYFIYFNKYVMLKLKDRKKKKEIEFLLKKEKFREGDSFK